MHSLQSGKSQKLTAYLPLQTAIDFLETKKVAFVAKAIKQPATGKSKLQLRKEEIDIFHLKALSLILQDPSIQDPSINYPIGELLYLIHSCPIELRDADNCQIIARQSISAFPGEAIEVQGTFDREYVCNDVSFPIKESFHISYNVCQTGFPHPSQQTAFTWGEGLLALLKSSLPKSRTLESKSLGSFFQKKEVFSQLLLPTGRLRNKAKAHLDARTLLFQKSDHLFSLLKKLSSSLFFDVSRDVIDEYFEELLHDPRRFYELSRVHFEISSLFKQLSEWVSARQQTLSQGECRDLFENELRLSLEKIPQDTPCGRYQRSIGLSMVKVSRMLFLLLASEPLSISDFEIKVITSVFGEQLAFIEELETVPEGISLDLFEEYLAEQIEEKIALFEGLSLSQEYMLQAQELAKSVIHSPYAPNES